MNHFDIEFLYDRRHYTASVSVLKQGDHVQYTIDPHDKLLKDKFLTQVVHQFKGKGLEFAFPIEREHQEPYNAAIRKGLEAALSIK